MDLVKHLVEACRFLLLAVEGNNAKQMSTKNIFPEINAQQF